MTKKAFAQRKPYLFLLLSSVFLTTIFGLLTYSIMSGYYQNRPIWVEQAAYSQFPNLSYMNKILEQGLMPTIIEAIKGNERHLLQLFLLGFFPKLLGLQQAHLFLVLPSLVFFLSLLGYTIYRRTNSLIYSSSGILLFASFQGVFNEKWGIGSGFADYQSFFLLGSAVLCLINGIMVPRISWLIYSGIFLILAIFARTTTIFYALVVYMPILFLYLTGLYKSKRLVWKPKLIFLILIVFIALSAILFSQIRQLVWYYASTNAWGLRHPFSESAEVITYLLTIFIGTPNMLVIFLLLIFNLFRQLFTKVRDVSGGKILTLTWSNILKIGMAEIALIWWVVGFLGLLLVNGYISDVPKEAMYSTPPIIILILTPFVYLNSKWNNKINNRLGQFVIFLSIVGIIWSIAHINSRINSVSSDDLQYKDSQLALAKSLSSFPRGSVWQSYTIPDWGISVSVLTYFKHGNFIKSYNELFHNKKTYWDARYQNLSLQELKKEVYRKTASCIDIAVVLKEPNDKPTKMEDYSYEIAKYISQEISNDPTWEFYKQDSGKPFTNDLVIYVNKQKRSYDCTPKYE